MYCRSELSWRTENVLEIPIDGIVEWNEERMFVGHLTQPRALAAFGRLPPHFSSSRPCSVESSLNSD